MPRKRRKRNKGNSNNNLTSNQNFNPSAIASQIAQLYDTNQLISYYGRGIKPKYITINYDVMDKMAERNPIINAIIQKRTQQARPFMSPATGDKKRGFIIQPIAPTKKPDEKRILELTNFFRNTGFGEDPDREDDLADFSQMLVRDALTFDQNALEMRRTRAGDIFDFWYVDGTTISRLTKDSPFFHDGYRFAQRDEKGLVTAVFRPESMIFDYMNKRGRLRYRGYGYSPLEMMIDMITTFLFTMAYNKDLFVKEKIPKGFLKVTGDVDQKALNAIRNHWVAELSGYGGKFAVPIIGSFGDNVGIDWEDMGKSNRDMEYIKLVSLLIAMMCAVYSIDPAEIGIKTDMGQKLMGEREAPRLNQSRSTGLGSILAYIETILNKILRYVDPNYEIVVVGLEDDDESKKAEVRKTKLATNKTIDQLREEDGDKPFNEPWSQMVLNSETVQIYLAEKQAEEFGAGGMGGGGEPGIPGEEPEVAGGDEIPDTGNKEEEKGGAENIPGKKIGEAGAKPSEFKKSKTYVTIQI